MALISFQQQYFSEQRNEGNSVGPKFLHDCFQIFDNFEKCTGSYENAVWNHIIDVRREVVMIDAKKYYSQIIHLYLACLVTEYVKWCWQFRIFIKLQFFVCIKTSQVRVSWWGGDNIIDKSAGSVVVKMVGEWVPLLENRITLDWAGANLWLLGFFNKLVGFLSYLTIFNRLLTIVFW